jgi:ADP-ribosylglycohydrolase
MQREGSSGRPTLASTASFKSRLSFGSGISREKATEEEADRNAIPTSLALYQAQEIEVTKRKCKLCVLGALLGDAASYNLSRLSKREREELVAQQEFSEHPEFYSAPGSASETGAQRNDKGNLTPAGDESLPLLQSLVTHGGLDGPHLTHTSFDFFKEYKQTPSELARRFARSVKHGNDFPAGVSLNTMQAITKVPFIVARYAGKEELLVKVADGVRVHQSSNIAMQLGTAAAKILERVVLGTTLLEALAWSQSEGILDACSQKLVQTVLQSLSVSHSVFVAKNGSSDRLPGAFLGSLHAAAISGSFEEGVRHTLKAGGEGMSGRAMLAGALLAAEHYKDDLPEDWLEQVKKLDEYKELADKLVSQRAIISILPP